jgi:hypothetical protein
LWMAKRTVVRHPQAPDGCTVRQMPRRSLETMSVADGHCPKTSPE